MPLERYGGNLKLVHLKLRKILNISCEIALRWLKQNLTDYSTLTQALTWCRQTETHYLWPLLLTWFNFNTSMDK